METPMEKSNKLKELKKHLREVVLDTETTGLYYNGGDRIVEIACVELIDHIPTGSTYQTYINPSKKMSRRATAVNGITDDFLQGKPSFAEIVDDFLNFVKDSALVIHNARFDIGFLNSELARLDKPLFNLHNAIDTLKIARKKFSGAVNLDALCERFNVDISNREKHGALIDCQLLTDVYMHLLRKDDVINEFAKVS
jgi:DNA polymerase-3 subunit epsilon